MLGLNGGLMGVRKVPTTGTASGLWDQNEQSVARRAGIWPLTGGDPDFASVSLLLPFDGADNSTVFTDVSTNNTSLTRTGTPAISTAQSQFGDSSLLLAGGSNYLSIASNFDKLDLPGDFTVECGVRSTSSNDQIVCGNDLTYNVQIFRLNYISVGRIYCFLNGPDFLTAPGLVSVNTWHHLALTRSGTSLKLFIDGTEQATTSSSALITLRAIGSIYGVGVVGNIDNFRVTKGVARYTANFTPPTAAFPNS